MMAGDVIGARWAGLSAMDRSALRVAWAEAFGTTPPHFLSMIFMRKALIWHEQCRRFGGLPQDLKRALNAVADGKPARDPALAVRPGTQLIREWNGRRYQVDATENGFVLNDKRYKSLSAVALHITGTSWSGPRFFGLNKATGSGA
ncbi:DUF2924 domain-containing protein [Defluviimonas sp. SAOS-178_SWC]|uniref:DUF2924 domain-containing protein n=1 Tax=Defluviimonas sp. SAOS-178_SWC TaxID=3121287 RepID=UPI0032219B04